MSSKHSERHHHRQFVIALSMLFSLNQQSPRTCLIFSKSPGQAKICGYLLLGGESVARGLDLVPPGDKTDSRPRKNCEIANMEALSWSWSWSTTALQPQYQSQYERLGDSIVVTTGILLVPWLHILKHCYQQEFACKHTKILLVDILVPVFRPHFTVCNPLSNINN